MGVVQFKEARELGEAENAERLSSWFTGEKDGPLSSAHTVLVQAGADVRALVESDLLAPDALVFSSAPAALFEGTGVRHVEVDGDTERAGDELIMSGSLYIQVFDYCSLPYLSIAAPTVVRMTCADDYEAFLDDADQAVREGKWSEGLSHQCVQLADLATLTSPLRATGLGRLFITSEGKVRTGVGGQDLGPAEAGVGPIRAAAAAADGDPSLGSVVPSALLHSGAAKRHWLPRYAHALEVRRRLAGRFGTDLRISGFGGRFTPELPRLPVEHANRPLLVAAGGDIYAVRTADYRLFRLGTSSACLVEVFSALCAEDTADTRAQAAAAAERLLKLPADEVLRMYAAIEARLGDSTTAHQAAEGAL